jgi:uncharacterized protein YyaL (SSP411 family)
MTILPAKNLLASESSPYLRQHAHNPVHWRPWSAEALAEAKATQRPILLSVGYAACHWCHVMAHESFEDEQVAAVMNRLFVNIKVDREERPDVDQIYMAALTAMGEQGGWPLTMFLTPDAKPFWGGTYFPREPRYGRPGFIQIMEAIGQTWLEKRADLEAGSEALSDHISQRLASTNIHSNLDARLLPAFADAIYSSLDMERGGLRGAPKFPNAPFMDALWMNGVRNGHDDHATAVAFSLQCMLSGGIYDHIGGGLCRYSTDAEWMVPHFEKMLYDNAQLISLGSAVYAQTGERAFKRAIEETIAWVQREMMAEGGGFASSLDADSEGEEGRFYLWTREEIETALGDDADRFMAHYALARPDGWEGEPILYLRDEPSELAREDLTGLKSRLLAARETRVRPGRDDKVLTDWNGLMISALANASRVLDRSDWLEIATSAYDSIVASARDGRLPHSRLGDVRLFPAMASDYAAMINAAISLYEASGSSRYISDASAFLSTLDRWYIDEDGFGYFLTASDANDVPLRIRGDVDEAIPSATAQIIKAVLRLSLVTSDSELYDRAVDLAEHALGRTEQQRYGRAGIIAAAELVREPRKLMLVDEQNGRLVSEANRNFDLSRTDVIIPRSAEGQVTLPDGSFINASEPGAYLCIGQSCRPPVRDAESLAELLRSQG